MLLHMHSSLLTPLAITILQVQLLSHEMQLAIQTYRCALPSSSQKVCSAQSLGQASLAWPGSISLLG